MRNLSPHRSDPPVIYCYKQLTEELAQPIESFFDNADQSTWASIRKLYNGSIEKALSDFTSTLSGFELDSVDFDNLKINLKHHARVIVQNKSTEKVGNILTLLKDRFLDVFDHENDSLPRVWTGNEDIKKIMMDSRIAALKVLSIFTVIRLDEKIDQIESILISALIDTPTAKERQITTLKDPLSSNLWEEIPPEDTLISPCQCRSLWKKFIKETDFIVYDKMSIQGALRRNNVMPLISWKVITLTISLLCMTLRRNPLTSIMVLFVILSISTALRKHRDNIQLDNITRRFEHAMVAGLLSILSRPRLTPWLSRGKHRGHRGMRYGTCRQGTSLPNWRRPHHAICSIARNPHCQTSSKCSTCDYESLKAYS